MDGAEDNSAPVQSDIRPSRSCVRASTKIPVLPVLPAGPSAKTIAARNNALKRTASANELKKELQKKNALLARLAPAPSQSATKASSINSTINAKTTKTLYTPRSGSSNYDNNYNSYESYESPLWDWKPINTPATKTLFPPYTHYTPQPSADELTRKRRREDEDRARSFRIEDEDRSRRIMLEDEERERQRERERRMWEAETEARTLSTQASRQNTSFSNNLALQSAAHDQHQMMWGLQEQRDQRIAIDRRKDRQLDLQSDLNNHSHTERVILKNSQPQMLSIATLGAAHDDVVAEELI